MLFMLGICLFTEFANPTTWKILTVVGLGFDLAGAVLLVIPEIPKIPESHQIALIKKGRDHLFFNDRIYQSDDGFSALMDLIEANAEVTIPDDIELMRLNSYVGGTDRLYLETELDDSDKIGVGTSNSLRTWINQKLDELNYRRYFRAGVFSLMIGFGLQIIAYVILNFQLLSG